jgi:hypothetical protein
MSPPRIHNYEFKYLARGKWIFVPSVHGERRAQQVLNFFRRGITFPDYFYHYKPGGHVAALHEHIAHEFFFRIDIQNFFYSIARNRVHRALASNGMAGAPTYAKWSTVRSPYEHGPRYVLPIGFWQSPHIASLVLVQSPVLNAIERAREKDVMVSVYLDDIIGSHNDEDLLREAYEDIRQACVDSNLVPNPDKLVEPSKAIVAFNCDLTKGSTKVTSARIARFRATGPDAFSQQAFDAYIARVARANLATSVSS